MSPALHRARSVASFRNLLMLVVGFILPALWMLPPVTAEDDPLIEQQARAEQIQELIEQLGSDSYFVRDRAEKQLAAMGFDAFDALTAAELHPDLEIAARARYLVRLMQVEWTQDGDSPAVEQLLSGYDQLDDAARIDRIQRLGELPDSQGLAALCRLARFQKSEPLSKLAALAATGRRAENLLLEKLPTGIPFDDVARDVVDAARQTHRDALGDVLNAVTDQQRRTIIAGVGTSPRPAAEWLRAYAQLSQDPSAAIQTAAELIDQEALTLEQFPQRSSRVILLEMLGQQVHWLLALDRDAEARAAMARMLDFEPGDAETLPQLLRWLVEREVWPVIDEVNERFATQMEKNPQLLYNMAYARLRSGDTAAAEELAARALAAGQDTVEQRCATAIELQRLGWIQWALNEYWQLIKISSDPGSPYVLRSQLLIGELLYDLGEYAAAAEVLRESAEVLDRVAKDGQVTASRDPSGTRARMNYFLALQHVENQEWAVARDLLEKSLTYDVLDADVLIALYRLPNIDQARRDQIRQSVEQAVQQYEMQIIQDPQNPTPYNQIAWLVSNTEGNKQRALQLSQKSLELKPQAAGFMDTLGRCYYALQDYPKAIAIQRAAVLQEPYSGQMSRQLALFQAALAEQKATHAEATKPNDQTPDDEPSAAESSEDLRSDAAAQDASTTSPALFASARVMSFTPAQVAGR